MAVSRAPRNPSRGDLVVARIKERTWWEQALSDAMECATVKAVGYLVRRTADMARAGLYGSGTPAPESLARLGHLGVVARGLRYLDRQGRRFKLRGRHGGLSPEEMLVPWLAARLDD